ncbi:MAG: TolC family protein [Planctomycetes bacterium]|nr:TolC family protein [Planctomycetota bacterium]
MPPPSPRRPLLLCSILCVGGCWSAAGSKESADSQVYGILERATARVTGQDRTFGVERPIDTLRQRLLDQKRLLDKNSPAGESEPVALSLNDALDVAAENSREFQRQKEQLYLTALSLTRARHDFEVIFGGGGSADIDGEADTKADVTLRDDLSAGVTTASGMRIVGSFVNSFLRSVIHGGSFDGSSILSLTLTQPLLRGAGRRIVTEPLVQAERDVVYAVRDFERFRAQFALRVVNDYWDVVAQMADLVTVDNNLRSRRTSRERVEELFRAGRADVTDLGREKQGEYSAEAQKVSAKNRLQTALDRFKLTLGLPVTAQITLDPGELDRLQQQGVEPIDLDEPHAIALALERRFDHQSVVDNVEDAGRRVFVAEDALSMSLDFSAALNVPAESGKGLNLDWSKVNWSAGFELDLALDKLAERNSYRSALISLDVAIRNREQSEDQIGADVRASLRNIQSAIDTYEIQTIAVDLARQRVEATTDLFLAGRAQAFEKLDAQDDLLASQLDLTAAIVNYASARLQLMHDLEAIALEGQGLRFDAALPLPKPGTRTAAAHHESGDS